MKHNDICLLEVEAKMTYGLHKQRHAFHKDNKTDVLFKIAL